MSPNVFKIDGFDAKILEQLLFGLMKESSKKSKKNSKLGRKILEVNKEYGFTPYRIYETLSGNRDKSLSKKTISDRVKELLQKQFIKKIGTSDRKGEVYDITVFGFIAWLRYLEANPQINQREINEIIDNSHRLTPWLSENYSKLRNIFEDDPFGILLKTVKTIDIIEDDPNIIIKAQMNVGRISVTIDTFQLMYSGADEHEMAENFDKKLGNTMTAVFLHNLIMSYRQPELFDKYDAKKESQIFHLIESDPLFALNEFEEFFRLLKNHVYDASSYLEKIKSMANQNGLCKN